MDDCNPRWDLLLKLWSESDSLVRDLIAIAKGGPHEEYQQEGKRTKRLENEWRNLAGIKHGCGKRVCQEEDEKMLEITRRNLDRLEQAQKETSLQEHQEQGGLERTDKGYQEWKEWKDRDMRRERERNDKITASRKKEEGWALYRECTAILSENKTKWLERSEMAKVEW